ncbi:hypothetical protein L211DRAFT_867931 [Terfezia boudieri ATCC MYA-4762]|uniref:STEEP1 domain-containing protein n=1 Tax=Terfezia boudieri ATCC MYA-4762 TaxID=1051890 RepID=A0A3N4LNX2_9PEZI|nr:hypothetical protein L211DRAFT_867931 [Terfezia boudieri ATCC MYA-4762]
MTSPKVHTYHCTFCSHLLLATTLWLPTLPTRQPPSLDRAIIAPLPPPPRNPDSGSTSPSPSSSSSSSSSDSDSDSDCSPPHTTTNTNTPLAAAAAAAIARSTPPPPPRPRKQKDYTLLLSSTRDRTPKIITREDGFEKRYFWRCGRCKVVYGYQLDNIHYPSSTTATTTAAQGEGNGMERDQIVQQRRTRKKKRDYVYFLPGALTPTEQLGREVADGESVFPGVSE